MRLDRRAATALLPALALLAGLALLTAAPASAANKPPPLTVPFTTTTTNTDERLNVGGAERIFMSDVKVANWLSRYPRSKLVKEATFNPGGRYWEVKVWYGTAGEIAQGKVDDGSGVVTEAWTGPQVAWGMARGLPGAFGGKPINSVLVWLIFCALFVAGLADLRRPLSLRNLDLLALLGFSASLWYFNRGHIFTSVPLVYPPLVYLIVRLAVVGLRGRPLPPWRPLFPGIVLLGAVVFLVGFRIGLNTETSNVIDVGYAGVIGADRILNGQAPWGHFPTDQVNGHKLKPCIAPDANGNVRDRVQANGVCESVNPQGDTYGPVAYIAYIPGKLLFGWSHKWDDLPAVHFTSIVFDLLCLAGMALIGFRFGGRRMALTLAFAWVAYPFTQYVSNSNSNDAIVPVFLIWGFWLVSSPWARGAATALSGLTKFTTLIVAPLWVAYPNGLLRPGARGWRQARSFVAAFVVSSLAVFSLLLLEPSLLQAVKTFWNRTAGWQLGRPSPFSLWDWRQYHAAGIPDLHALQVALEIALLAAAVVLAFVPRRRSPLRLAAFSGCLIAGVELVLTHWFYLYIVWFFPFVAIALLAGESRLAEEQAGAPEPIGRLLPAPLPPEPVPEAARDG
ncbi:MAG: hypothetical protein ACXVZW_08980 [Gaiellaceae bacterium]